MIAQSLFIYTILVVFMTVCIKLSEKTSNNLYLVAALLFFAFIAGFRYGVGIDCNNYRDAFDSLSEQRYYESRGDYGILYLIQFCQVIGLSRDGYMMIWSGLQMLFIFLAFRDRKDVLVYVPFILVTQAILMMSYWNGMRQCFACSILLFAIHFIVKKKFVPFLLSITLAALFHKSAIVLVLFYFIWWGGRCFFNNRNWQFVLFLATVPFKFIDILQNYMKYIDMYAVILGYEGYMNTEAMENTVQGIGLMDILSIALYFLVFFNSPRMKAYFNSRFFNVIYDLSFIGILFSNVFSGSMMMMRLGLYFTYFIPYLLAFTMAFFQKRHGGFRPPIESRKLIFTCLVTYFMISFGRVIYYSEGNTIQYAFSFQKEYCDIKDRQLSNMTMTQVN